VVFLLTQSPERESTYIYLVPGVFSMWNTVDTSAWNMAAMDNKDIMRKGKEGQ